MPLGYTLELETQVGKHGTFQPPPEEKAVVNPPLEGLFQPLPPEPPLPRPEGVLVVVSLPHGAVRFQRMSQKQADRYHADQRTREAWADFRWRADCEKRLMRLCVWNNAALKMLRAHQAEFPNKPPTEKRA